MKESKVTMNEPTVLKGAQLSTADRGVAAPTLSDTAAAENGLICGEYHLRYAQTTTDLEAALRLRFLVFNLELNKGLESAFQDGLDRDLFDSVCDHLIVEHRATQTVVGTYRLQTGETAAGALGYYSRREFDFAPYEPMRSQMVELGRAAIDRKSVV